MVLNSSAGDGKKGREMSEIMGGRMGGGKQVLIMVVVMSWLGGGWWEVQALLLGIEGHSGLR